MANSEERGMIIRYEGEGNGGAGGDGGAGSTGSLLTGGDGGTGSPGAGTGNPGSGEQNGGEVFKLPDGWDYRTALPPELKESPSAKKYANIEELVRGFDNAQQLIGKPTERLVEIPPNIDDAGRMAVLEKMGHPKNFADYKIEAPKGAEQVLKIDSPNFKALAEVAHKAGVHPTQFQGIIDTFGQQIVAGQKEMADAEIQRNADNVTALKTKWGEAFDSKVSAANTAIDKLGGDKAGVDALRESINRSGLGTDGPLLDMLSKVGEMLAEDATGGDGGGGITAPMTPSAAKDEGTRILQEAIGLMGTNPIKARELNLKAQEFFAKAEKRAR